MSKQDDQFIREFGVLLGCLFVFFLLALFIARSIGSSATEQSQLAPGEVAQRIMPIGHIELGEAGEMAALPEPAVEAAAGPAKSGLEVYSAACIACHATGAAGAPKLGDVAAWEPRVAQGMEALVNSSINGKGLMPPRAGQPSLTDEEIANGVKYMLEQSGLSAN